MTPTPLMLWWLLVAVVVAALSLRAVRRGRTTAPVETAGSAAADATNETAPGPVADPS